MKSKEEKVNDNNARRIHELSKATKLSPALLAYALHFGIIGIVGNRKRESKKQKV